MRWRAVKSGDTRVIKVFALLPMQYRDTWYWLEWVEKRQRYDSFYFRGWYDI